MKSVEIIMLPVKDRQKAKEFYTKIFSPSNKLTVKILSAELVAENEYLIESIGFVKF